MEYIRQLWQALQNFLSFNPVSPKDREKALGAKATKLENLVAHAEKEAALRERITKAEKRINAARGLRPRTNWSMGKTAIALLILVAIILLGAKACGG